ncbi:MAG: hypothetical protein P8104_03630 [Gammaproteobacteria bacterium]
MIPATTTQCSKYKYCNGFWKFFRLLALGVLPLLTSPFALASLDHEDFEKLSAIVDSSQSLDFTVVKPVSATAYVNGFLETADDTNPALSGELTWTIAAGESSSLKFAPGTLRLTTYFYAEQPNATLRLRAYDEHDQLITERTLTVDPSWQNISMHFASPAYRIDLENFSNGKIRIDDLLTHRLDYTEEAQAMRQSQSRAIIERDPFTGAISVNVGGVSVRVGNGVAVQVGNLVSVSVGNGVSVQVGGVLVEVGNGVRVVIGGNSIIDTIGNRASNLITPNSLGAGMSVISLALLFAIALMLITLRRRRDQKVMDETRT